MKSWGKFVVQIIIIKCKGREVFFWLIFPKYRIPHSSLNCIPFIEIIIIIWVLFVKIYIKQNVVKRFGLGDYTSTCLFMAMIFYQMVYILNCKV